jgi:hypothetical protein
VNAIDWKEVVAISTATLPLVVAILTVYIAWQQWKTNRSRELRESRQSKLAVYRRVKPLIRHVLYTSTLDPKLYADFCDACAEADFLFKDEPREWLGGLQDIAARCMSIQEPLENAARDSDLNSINKMQRELDELTEKLRSVAPLLRDKFTDHLV